AVEARERSASVPGREQRARSLDLGAREQLAEEIPSAIELALRDRLDRRGPRFRSGIVRGALGGGGDRRGRADRLDRNGLRVAGRSGRGADQRDFDREKYAGIDHGRRGILVPRESRSTRTGGWTVIVGAPAVRDQEQRSGGRCPGPRASLHG